ncbi:MAG: MFS transporter [Hyphomonadaceae bacterium]|nr:MFS transporter [Hyphomonadaceae bacterium]
MSEAAPGKVQRAVPLIIAASFFIEELDASIITTSLPQMAADLGASPTRLSAAVTAYLLSVALFLPVSGWLADRFGALRVYCTSIVVFAAGSLLCGAATSYEMLLAGRVVQGLGGALMTPVGRLIVVRSVAKDQLIVATNYMIAPALIGSMLGPVVGGFITTYASWRWNFYLNIPVAMLGVLLALRLIKDDLPAAARSAFDWRGFVLLAAGLASLQIAVEMFGHNKSAAARSVCLALFAVAAFAGYWLHARRRRGALLDLGLLRVRTFAITIFAGSFSRTAAGAIPFLLPLLFQLGFGLSPLESGMLTVAMALGVLIMRAGVSLALRVFSMRALILGNTILLAFLVAALTLLTPSTPHWAIFACLFVLGAVRSVNFSNLTALSYADLTPDMTSGATTMVALAGRFCACLGVGLAAALLAMFSNGRAVEQADFNAAFVCVAALFLASAIGLSRLRADDGWQLSGRSAPRS